VYIYQGAGCLLKDILLSKAGMCEESRARPLEWVVAVVHELSGIRLVL
jgi:hypothetical protein